MDADSFKTTIEDVAKVIDAAGVAVIIVGFLIATAQYADRVLKRAADAYRGYRQGIGRSILLGLELLVAADIIRTVAISPSFRGVGVLAIIVAVRTFLSFTLEVELTGRWPWQSPTSREQGRS